MKINELRWNRIDESNLSFETIRIKVKDKYSEEIKEDNIKDFFYNINNYPNIKEGELLSLLENISYNKISILSIKNEENNINDIFSTEIGRDVFSKTLKIDINNPNLCTENLDTSVYTLSHYNYKSEKIVELYLYAIKEYETEDDISGIGYSEPQKVIDIVKFIIDLENCIVYMLYKDIDISHTKGKDITNRKKAFIRFFPTIQSKNLNQWDIDEYLLDYVYDYIRKKLECENSKKLITIIKATNKKKRRDSLESIKDDYNHSKSRLIAIKEELDAKTHTISVLECSIKSNIIRLKNNGELSILNNTFQPEVIRDVCNEIFKGEYSI